MAEFAIWNGVYPDFASAAGKDAITPDGQGGFQGNQWIDKSVARARALEAAFRAPGAVSLAGLSRDYVLPTVAALAHPGDRALHVVDFGGGLAFGFFPVAAALPREAALTFDCVENGEICATGRSLFGSYSSLRFHETLTTIEGPVDIVHAGSALHYIEDWRGMLARFAAFKPRYLVLSDIPAGAVETFASVQTYYERRIRHWFWNVDEFISAVIDAGFDLVMRGRYQGVYLGKEGPYPMDNFPPERRIGHPCQFVFKLRQR